MLAMVATLGTAEGAFAAPSDLIFVVSEETPIQSVSLDDLQNIYLGKKRTVGVTPVSAVDHGEAEPIKQVFLERVLHMTQAQYREQLMRRHFQEGAVTPKFVENSSEALNRVRETPGAIGYVLESEAGTLLGIRVIATIPAK
jgi:hypothetical protein